jgi:hypothetical protein
MDGQQDQTSRVEQMKSQAGETIEEVKSQADEAVGEVKTQAREATDRASSYMRDMLDNRSQQAGHWFSKAGTDLTEAGATLRERGDDMPARVSESVGRRMSELGTYMESKSGDEVLDDAQRFARKNVWALTIGGLVVGFAAARTLGAAMRHEGTEEQRMSAQERTWPEDQAAQEPWPSSYQGPVVVATDEERDGPATRTEVGYG